MNGKPVYCQRLDESRVRFDYGEGMIVDRELEFPESASVDESETIPFVFSNGEGCLSRIVLTCVPAVLIIRRTIETELLVWYR